MIIINTKQNSRRLSTIKPILENRHEFIPTTATHYAIKNPLIMYS